MRRSRISPTELPTPILRIALRDWRFRLVTGPRRVRFPPAPHVSTIPTEDTPPWVFTIRFPDCPGCEVDLTAAACPRLIRDPAAALRQLAQLGGRIAAHATVHAM